MATISTQIRIEEAGIPFEADYPKLIQEIIKAMEEAKRISHNPSTKRYTCFAEALEDLNNEI